MKQYPSDCGFPRCGCTNYTGTAVSLNVTAMLLGTNCWPLATPGNALSYSLGCVGDIPKMIMHSSSDCSGDCVLATTEESISTECTPSVRARSQAPFQSDQQTPLARATTH